MALNPLNSSNLKQLALKGLSISSQEVQKIGDKQSTGLPWVSLINAYVSHT